jgi:oligopeptide transport system permease protein
MNGAGLLPFALRRLALAVPTLAAILCLSFLLMRAAPGGPFDRAQPLPAEVKANLERYYGLDAPVLVQLRAYVAGALTGDLGPSLRRPGLKVSELLAAGLPVSLGVGTLALALALLLGLPLGILGALRRNAGADRLLSLAIAIGQAMPLFVLAPLLALALGLWLPIFPVGGWHTGDARALVLPVLCLALPTLLELARLLRASLLETLSEPFIQGARARGLSPARIVLRYALPPALVPVLGFLGPAAATILSGSLVVETVFGLPGAGRYLVEGALSRDYTLVLGAVLCYAALLMGFNLLVDILQRAIDPRQRGHAR